MDSTVAGLIGAAIGALAAIASAFVTSTLQARQEHRTWLRDRKQEAYANSVRYILRVLNKRSKVTAEGMTFLGQDVMKEWFDDMSEAEIWLTALSIYCSPAQRAQIVGTLDGVRKAISGFISSDTLHDRIGILDTFSSAYETVSSSERIDISQS
jgi:hypothetical protein